MWAGQIRSTLAIRYTADMLKLLRYTLAAIFLAASAGCLAGWGWNFARSEILDMANLSVASITFKVEAYDGIAAVWSEAATPSDRFWRAGSHRVSDIAQFAGIMRQQGRFGTIGRAIYFPLWYPALVFALAALAAVGVLRLGRRFTIRSTLSATTVVAALLGMIVAL